MRGNIQWTQEVERFSSRDPFLPGLEIFFNRPVNFAFCESAMFKVANKVYY